MGKELMSFPVFQQTLIRLEEYLLSIGCPWLLRKEILRDQQSHINRPDFLQPLCTAVRLALVDLLRSFGIAPTPVVGHSSGEIAAAYCIGAISDTSAMKLAYYRGSLASRLATSDAKRGAMMSVGLSIDEVTPYIAQSAAKYGRDGLVVACINSPKNATISGDEKQIDILKPILEAEKIFHRKLLVDFAYHSPHMRQFQMSIG
jgi:acyl transferase domain-containing protein